MSSVIKAEETNVIEVWPENWPAFETFICLQTQWNIGMAGPTGLKYEPLFQLLDHRGYTGEEWEEMFADIRLLERTALEVMNSKAS